ncbi:MAG: lysophospholipid acyltransferase family protein [Nanoarchaeota archaeon]
MLAQDVLDLRSLRKDGSKASLARMRGLIDCLLREDELEKGIVMAMVDKVKAAEAAEFVVSEAEFKSLRDSKDVVRNIAHVFGSECDDVRGLLGIYLKSVDAAMAGTVGLEQADQILSKIESETSAMLGQEEKMRSYLAKLKTLTYSRRFIKSGVVVAKVLTTPVGVAALTASPLTKEPTRLFMHVDGVENVPSKGPIIIAAHHHHAALDPLVLLATMKRPIFFLASTETFVVSRLYGWWLRRMGHLPFTRDDGRRSRLTGTALEAKVDDTRQANTGSMRQAIRHLEVGDAIGIFPEDDAKVFFPTYIRENGQEFIPPKAGLVYLADVVRRRRGVAVPIVPVGFLYAGRHVRVRFGPPMSLASPSDGSDEGYRSFLFAETERVFKVIMDLSR